MLRRKRRKGREEIKIVDFLPAVDFFISWYLFPDVSEALIIAFTPAIR